jgi:6,7-dimethyl-8-ribityllumazine synthase
MAGARKAKPAQDAGADRLEGARVLVVEARYYGVIADELLAGAREVLERAGCRIDLLTVPGALEIPSVIAIALRSAAESDDPYEGVVALGCVIRGETGHYDIVAGESARALMDISVAYEMPLGNGILTVETEAQALARARRAEMNKGAGAAEAALAVLAIRRRLEGKREGTAA